MMGEISTLSILMKKERKEVRNLILMLSSAICLAFVVVLVMVYYFGASGTRALNEVLVSPQTLKVMDLEGEEARGSSAYQILEFERGETQGRGWGKYAVSLRAYKEFYNFIATERSLSQVTDEMVQQFDRTSPSTLTILIQSKKEKATQKGFSVYQQVQFLNGGDLFRIETYDPGEGETSQPEWVYFRRPGIYQKVLELFVPSQP